MSRILVAAPIHRAPIRKPGHPAMIGGVFATKSGRTNSAKATAIQAPDTIRITVIMTIVRKRNLMPLRIAIAATAERRAGVAKSLVKRTRQSHGIVATSFTTGLIFVNHPLAGTTLFIAAP